MILNELNVKGKGLWSCGNDHSCVVLEMLRSTGPIRYRSVALISLTSTSDLQSDANWLMYCLWPHSCWLLPDAEGRVVAEQLSEDPDSLWAGRAEWSALVDPEEHLRYSTQVLMKKIDHFWRLIPIAWLNFMTCLTADLTHDLAFSFWLCWSPKSIDSHADSRLGWIDSIPKWSINLCLLTWPSIYFWLPLVLLTISWKPFRHDPLIVFLPSDPLIVDLASALLEGVDFVFLVGNVALMYCTVVSRGWMVEIVDEKGMNLRHMFDSRALDIQILSKTRFDSLKRTSDFTKSVNYLTFSASCFEISSVQWWHCWRKPFEFCLIGCMLCLRRLMCMRNSCWASTLMNDLTPCFESCDRTWIRIWSSHDAPDRDMWIACCRMKKCISKEEVCCEQSWFFLLSLFGEFWIFSASAVTPSGLLAVSAWISSCLCCRSHHWCLKRRLNMKSGSTTSFDYAGAERKRWIVDSDSQQCNDFSWPVHEGWFDSVDWFGKEIKRRTPTKHLRGISWFESSMILLAVPVDDNDNTMRWWDHLQPRLVWLEPWNITSMWAWVILDSCVRNGCASWAHKHVILYWNECTPSSCQNPKVLAVEILKLSAPSLPTASAACMAHKDSYKICVTLLHPSARPSLNISMGFVQCNPKPQGPGDHVRSISFGVLCVGHKEVKKTGRQ